MAGDDDGGDRYEKTLAAYDRDIRKYLTLRDAQIPNTDRYHEFQDELTRLTEERQAWEDAIPRLRELDRLIAGERHSLERFRADAEALAENYRRATLVTGVLALVCALLWWAGLGAIPAVLAVLSLLAAGLCGLMAGRATQRSDNELHAASRLASYEAEYNHLYSKSRR